MTANDDELPHTAMWVQVFAEETEESQRSSIAVLAGLLNDPAMLRRIAESLER